MKTSPATLIRWDAELDRLIDNITDPIFKRVRERDLEHPHPLFKLSPRGRCLACGAETDEGDVCSLLCLPLAVLVTHWHADNELAEENWAAWCEEMERWDTIRGDVENK